MVYILVINMDELHESIQNTIYSLSKETGSLPNYVRSKDRGFFERIQNKLDRTKGITHVFIFLPLDFVLLSQVSAASTEHSRVTFVVCDKENYIQFEGIN